MYQKYDIIETKHSLGPVSFVKTTAKEVDVSFKENDIEALIAQKEASFVSRVKEEGTIVSEVEKIISEDEDSVFVTFRVLCERDISIERRMTGGKNTTVTKP